MNVFGEFFSWNFIFIFIVILEMGRVGRVILVVGIKGIELFMDGDLFLYYI